MGRCWRRLAVLLRVGVGSKRSSAKSSSLHELMKRGGTATARRGLGRCSTPQHVGRLARQASRRSQSRDVWMWPGLQDIMQDIRFAARLLVKDRRFTLVSLLVLGLGIGINNMLFTILNAHTIRGLPIDQPDRVLYISTVDDQNRPRGMSFRELEDLRTAAQSFSGICGASSTRKSPSETRVALPSGSRART